MVEFSRCQLTEETVNLDGNQYVDCTFNRCQMVFSATAPTLLDRCNIIDCRWTFADGAARTIDFMRSLYAMGGGAVVLIEHTFDQIRGVKPAPGG